MYCIFYTEHVESGQIEPRALKKKVKTRPLENLLLYDISSCYCNIKFNNWMILIEHTLILFPPLNSTHILAHSEIISSTHGKYSRKYDSYICKWHGMWCNVTVSARGT